MFIQKTSFFGTVHTVPSGYLLDCIWTKMAIWEVTVLWLCMKKLQSTDFLGKQLCKLSVQEGSVVKRQLWKRWVWYEKKDSSCLFGYENSPFFQSVAFLFFLFFTSLIRTDVDGYDIFSLWCTAKYDGLINHVFCPLYSVLYSVWSVMKS